MTSRTDFIWFIVLVGIYGLQYLWGYLNLKFVPWLLPVAIVGMVIYTIFNGQFSGLKDTIFATMATLMAVGNYLSGLDAWKKKHQTEVRADS